jgi:ABC-2 type transport system permease protein
MATTSTSAPSGGGTTALAEERRGAARTAFLALLGRDLVVLRKELPMFATRTVMQPLLLLFVFTYVFPKIGQGIGGGSTGAQAAFSTLLTAGVVGSAMIFQGIQAVALPLVQDFGFTREIEDRILAPLPVWGVALEKVAAGACQAVLAALVVFPLALVVPAVDVNLHVRPLVLLTLLPLGGVLSASLGLTIGTRVEPRQVSLVFSLLVIPMTFLGCVYYPWAELEPIRWLQVAVLVNPLVYLNEGLRAALAGGIGHMDLAAIYLVTVGFTAVLLKLGIDGFRRRVLS